MVLEDCETNDRGFQFHTGSIRSAYVLSKCLPSVLVSIPHWFD